MGDKVKYVRGNLCSESLTDRSDEWALIWHKIAKESQANGKNLVVVEVPADISWLKVASAIEDMIEIVVTEKQGKVKVIKDV